MRTRIILELLVVLTAALITNLFFLSAFGFRSLAENDDLGLSTFQISMNNNQQVVGAVSKVKKGRFPSYGTPEFEKMCNWTTHYNPEPRNCVTLTRLLKGSGEGLSSWISTIAGAHIITKQTGCRLLIDYGPGVDFGKLLEPNSNYNWTVPSDFSCSGKNRCSIASPIYADHSLKLEKKWTGLQYLTDVPHYRYVFSLNLKKYEAHGRYRNLSRVIPGFEAATGMACSLESLLRFAPTSTQFEPRLFDTLLPTLRSPHIFSLSVYIRTGHTENKDLPQEASDLENLSKADKAKLTQVDRIGACAMQVEEQLRTEEHTEVVWMLITDSQLVKRVFRETYEFAGNSSRRVLTSSSRGAHTKPQYGPSTADFAEAFIDWFLIGEADAVVDKLGSSFGKTGAFRTLRRYFEVAVDGGCEERFPVIR